MLALIGLENSNRGDQAAVFIEPLIDESKIRDRLVAMGRQIEDDLSGRKPLTIVASANGKSDQLLADLIRQIQDSLANFAGTG